MSKKSARIRPRAYGKVIFSPQEISEGLSFISPRLTELQTQWRQGHLPEPEVVAQYLLIYLQGLRPRDYLGARLKPAHSQDQTLPEGVQLFANFSLRSIPQAAHRTLVAWASGDYQLRLLDCVPQPLELLRLQASGQRVVTCFFRENEVTALHGGREAFVFALHDLIHADHFFRDKNLAREQIKFYQEILAEIEAGIYADYLADENFKQKFEYLIADMNSHPEHLRAYLRALISMSQSSRTAPLPPAALVEK
jgi:hypothetical protein